MFGAHTFSAFAGIIYFFKVLLTCLMKFLVLLHEIGYLFFESCYFVLVKILFPELVCGLDSLYRVIFAICVGEGNFEYVFKIFLF